ncbi:MAG: triose-phosphate isomerase [Pseudomonadota bacterium]
MNDAAETGPAIRPIVIGNWKMNGLAAALAESDAVAAHLREAGASPADAMICPPATLVAAMAARLSGGRVGVGGQDCHPEQAGAHTGDISAAMLADAGASAVIVGHSERRADHGESDALVRAKANAAFAHGLTPIICVGETLDERDGGETLNVVGRQLAGSVPDEAGGAAFIVAYEPVWAIGSGRTPTSAQIEDVHGFMRRQLGARFGAAGEAVQLLYGGSVKPANAAEILALENVNGALVGGASLKASDFLEIIAAA